MSETIAVRVFTDLTFAADAERRHGNYGWDYVGNMRHFHQDKGESGEWVAETTFSGQPLEQLLAQAGS